MLVAVRHFHRAFLFLLARKPLARGGFFKKILFADK
jgi:hypothetical protein